MCEIWNKFELIIDNLTFHSISKFLVQATAAFSTGKNITVAGIREIKVAGKSKSTLYADSEKASRMFFDCQLLGNFVKFPGCLDGATG